jgi:hypothetical protein
VTASAPVYYCQGCWKPKAEARGSARVEDDAVIGPVEEVANAYLRGEETRCPECQAAFDPWEDTLWHLGVGPRAGVGRTSSVDHLGIGLRYTTLNVHLKPREICVVRLEEHGVPGDARVLGGMSGSNRTDGNMFAHELRPAVSRPPKNVLHFIGHSFDANPVPSRTLVGVHWAPRFADDASRRSLVDSYAAFMAYQWERVIVPANIAVEFALGRLLNEFLTESGAARGRRENVQSFLRGEASYGSQLNILLPALTRFAGISAMPVVVASGLKTLKRLRNEMAHSGATNEPLDMDTTALVLCSAVFGFKYVQLVRELLTRPPGLAPSSDA